jgi:hypothetical protein
VGAASTATTHLAEAADRSTVQQRHDLSALLVRLVTEQGFQQAHLTQLRDPTLLQRDLELAQRLRAKDEHQDATFLFVPVALTVVLFNGRLLRPEAMFAAARDGNVLAAERLLDLFSEEIDSNWHDAILLTIAWLASEKAPGEALRVRNRVRDTEPSSPALAWPLRGSQPRSMACRPPPRSFLTAAGVGGGSDDGPHRRVDG